MSDDQNKIQRAGGVTLSTPESEYPEKEARTDYPIDKVMTRRWSTRAFDDRPVEREKVLTLLEAARWAPSCFNEQPWRFIVFDGSNPESLERARGCLVEGNAWARKAPVLMISVARDNFSANEKRNRTAQHDVGLATENLLLQATDLGLGAHAMAGFDLECVRREFRIPDGFTPLAMIAIGYPFSAGLDNLDDSLRSRELAARARKPLGEVAFAGTWDASY